ncbi:hypothetical protein VNO77_41610 [Canavalia gladiata]|uniref:Uncharacterized protein n=1 Tax=Canavalia gladiata TaxID=3824 RepID=A0AAN9PSM5_CANGL
MYSEVESAAFPILKCSENLVSRCANLVVLLLFARGSNISLSQSPFKITVSKIILKALTDQRSYVLNSEVESTASPVFRCSENHWSHSATLACLRLSARGLEISLSRSPFQISFIKTIFKALNNQRSHAMNSKVESAAHPVFRCSENHMSRSATLADLRLYARGSVIPLSQSPFQIIFFKIIFKALNDQRSQQ